MPSAEVKKYRKKPIVVLALKFDPEKRPWPNCVIPWSLSRGEIDGYYGSIRTPSGEAKVKAGDYIVQDVNGDFYARAADVFEKTHEEVEE